VVIEFCETIAARIFRLEVLLNFSKPLLIFRIYFTIPSSRLRHFCTMKCVYYSWSTSCHHLWNIFYFSSHLQCLKWCGSNVSTTCV